MILFQSSPVEIAKRRRKAVSNYEKFLSSSMTSPESTSAKRKLPRIENMK